MNNRAQRQRAAGSGAIEVLLIIAAFATFICVVAFRQDAPVPAPRVLSRDSNTWSVYIDPDTSCQYLGQNGGRGGITARIAADGRTHMGCKGGIRASRTAPNDNEKRSAPRED